MSPERRPTVRYSLVIPVLNEQTVLRALIERIEWLMAELDGPCEAIFINDGSTDDTAAMLERHARADPRFRVLELSRNFGHQAAITAGMDVAVGEAVIVMDADLQDPPEVVLTLVEKWKQGFEIVYAQRISRLGESRFKRWAAHLFYSALRQLASVDIPHNVGDFRLVDRKALNAFCSMRERDRFVRGMFGWLGFRQAAVPFVRQPRAAGETKYPLRKMVALAINGVFSFSDAPLRLVLWLGAAVSGLAVVYAVYAMITAIAGHGDLVRGWASTIIIVSFLSGMNMMVTGVIGIYVGRIHAEVKGRPLYVVGRDLRAASPDPQAEAESAPVAARSRRLAPRGVDVPA